ncbi:MAG: hypothetical protein EA364_00160, partial [Balneolaceae bacterium]
MKNEQLIITPKDDSLSEYVATGAGDFFYSITIKRMIGKSRFVVNNETYKIKASLLRKRRIELKLSNKLIAKAWRKNIISNLYDISFANSWLEMETTSGELKPCTIMLGEEEVGKISLSEPGSKRVDARLSELLDIRVRLFLVTIYLLN